MPIPRRLRAAGLHLLLSALVAGLVALLVFAVWYPHPYDAIAGGLSLFTLLISVDVVLGPALTAVAASPGKPLRELKRDLAVIVLLQAAGLGYGLYTIALARPVYMVFEVDRLRVVTAADIEPAQLAQAPAALRRLPWTGPGLIAAVKPTDPDQQMRAIELGLAGFDLAMLPRHWGDFESQRAAAWRAARPVAALRARYPLELPALQAIAAKAGQDLERLRFLPLLSRQASWVAIVAGPDVRLVGYLPKDGFF